MEWDDWAGDFTNPSAEDIAFEEDWAAVTGGQYTIDEIANQDDVQDLYYGYLEDPSILSSIGDILTKYGSSALSGLTKTFTKPGGGVDWRTIATIGGGVMGLMGVGKAEQRPTGYQGKIPEYTAVRERVGDTYDPERRPGSSGQRYFSDIAFAKPEGIEAARTAAQEQATGLGALNVANPAIQKRPAARAEPKAAEEIDTATRPASAVIEDKPVPQYAAGGIAGLKKGDYLRGDTDGMADKLRTTIENKQPAALSHGEFVVPADVVSHLGNGNSEAGAKKLYEMMNRIRQARTGTTKQGKQINPEKYTPA
jgi:hypothetical protein